MELAIDDSIDYDRCWGLLGSTHVGRLALSISALPAILPVQYFLDGHDIAVCLGFHSVEPRAIDGSVVAFAADSIGPDGTGWSVQVQGRSRPAETVEGRLRCLGSSPGQLLRLAPATVTGYEVRLCPLVVGGAVPPDL